MQRHQTFLKNRRDGCLIFCELTEETRCILTARCDNLFCWLLDLFVRFPARAALRSLRLLLLRLLLPLRSRLKGLHELSCYGRRVLQRPLARKKAMCRSSMFIRRQELGRMPPL